MTKLSVCRAHVDLNHRACGSLQLLLWHQKHLHNVETHFDSPQAFLSSEFHCRMDISVIIR